MACSPLSMVKLVDCWTSLVSSAPTCSSWTFSSAHLELKETLYLLMYLNKVLKLVVFFLGSQMKQRPYTPIRNDPDNMFLFQILSHFQQIFNFLQLPETSWRAVNCYKLRLRLFLTSISSPHFEDFFIPSSQRKN